ncbi:hypothetical protein SAMN05216570_2166 [Dyella sp. OK004]|uniref:hypothetical protein n=1 Tax=Dyella sp. OK004 TaxID=1855292 RepID=UPI0008E8CA0D|nr:hypothetical protein [Dyella sp. OK004]SFS06629.1 hypothetical protein SAMN05216570_2166 [Dyella sp. OK004]
MDRTAMRQRFEQMSDEELLRRYHSGDMTEDAMTIAADELRARQLYEAPVSDDGQDEVWEDGEPESFLDPADLVSLESLLDTDDARAVFYQLAAEGIAATTYATVPAQANPRISGGFGGVRFLVAEKDLPRATEVLHAYRRGDYALSEDEDPSEG